jgi:hypothetical protein
VGEGGEMYVDALVKVNLREELRFVDDFCGAKIRGGGGEGDDDSDGMAVGDFQPPAAVGADLREGGC